MTRLDISKYEAELLSRVTAEEGMAYLLARLEAAVLLEKADSDRTVAMLKEEPVDYTRA